MKHTLFIILLTLGILSVATTANAQIRVLNDLRKSPGVSYVYISKFMLQMVAGTSQTIDLGKMAPTGKADFSKLMSKIDGIQIINTEKERAIANVKAIVNNLVSKEKYEIMMASTENQENSTIYYKPAPPQSVILLLTEEDAKTLGVVAISGTFTEQDIKENLLK